MATSLKSVTQDRAMGNSHNTLKDYDEEYDSTWEDESDHEETAEWSLSAYRNTYAAKDMQTFRHRFQKTQQDWPDDDKHFPNLKFYQNITPFYPDGVYIEDFHKCWLGDYDRLEYVHSYIQWLFPIQEQGMNFASRELSLKEIKLFRGDEEVKKKLVTSYKLMLDFYGIELVSEETGEVKRAENWEERFANLNRNTHNNLRITRIIKCLGLLGLRHYQKPLVHFFLEETLVKGTLPRVKQSVLDYFMFAVLDKSERKELIRFAFCNFGPKEKFVWCPKRIQNKFLKEKGTESHKSNAGPNEGASNDSTSQGDQNDLMNSRVQNEDEIKTDTNEDTRNEKSLGSESRNDENASGECQDPEKQTLPLTAAGNAKTSDNQGIEVPLGVDSQHGHIDSEDKSAIQKDDNKAKQSKVLSGDKNSDSSTASDESTNENLTQTSNHSSTSENVANEIPLSGGNSGCEQQDHENQGDEFEQGNEDELKSQLTDSDSKENDSEEIQKGGRESPEDSVATGTATNEGHSANYDAEKSADKNSDKYTSSPGEANASNRSFEQTSNQNSVSSKELRTPGSHRSVEDEQQESDRGDELLNEPKATANYSKSQPNKDAQSKCGPILNCAVEGVENTDNV